MDKSTSTGQPFHNSQNIAETYSTVSNPDGRDFIGEPPGINFYTLFESISDAIFLLDGDKIIDCNKKTLSEGYGETIGG